jgi:hypothetical protein
MEIKIHGNYPLRQNVLQPDSFKEISNRSQYMHWIAKRIYLKSHKDMDIALKQIVQPFIEMVRNHIANWYCSRKTEQDGSRPSVRIYLFIDKKLEGTVLSKLSILLEDKRNPIGWTGKCEDEQTPEVSKNNLELIRKACEVALNLMNKYPDTNRHNHPEFKDDLKKALCLFINRNKNEVDNEAIHFIANNLGIRDDYFNSLIWLSPKLK